MKKLLTASFQLVIAECDGEILELNKKFQQTFDYQATELILTDFHVIGQKLPSICAWKQLLKQACKEGQWIGQLGLSLKNGEFVEFQTTVIPFDIPGQSNRQILLIVHDVSKVSEVEKWRNLACLHDLSLLPNRRSFQLESESILQRAEQLHMKVAVLYIDIDSFKCINDTFGHRAGNEVLQELGRRFKTSCSTNRYIFHFSGDEFVILTLFEDTYEEEVKTILSLCRAPFSIKDQMLVIDVSVGVSVYPEQGNDINQLLHYADTEMYAAKQSMRANLDCYESERNLLQIEIEEASKF
ncbi:sensor domain-containing diguanylate cyclase [Sporosarcina sp. PTS2304]|uniref:sensor domain-containing diguanylate cyclase n=1 Tax=Sporosarcina sp. PTS2304 TaxID=2283194 RepID=UPI0013B46BC2|nr:sensor domain-containing diguanylate cyclase [Sporosarcina sp. PTS2304]